VWPPPGETWEPGGLATRETFHDIQGPKMPNFTDVSAPLAAERRRIATRIGRCLIAAGNETDRKVAIAIGKDVGVHPRQRILVGRKVAPQVIAARFIPLQ